MEVTRRSGLLVLVAVALVLLSVPVLLARPSTAQTTDLVEVSESCVAIGQHFPALTVWGIGFEQWLTPPGSFLSVEWSWGGAPTSPNPALVLPLTRIAPAGTFTMTFDVTGVSQGLGGFSVIASNALGARTLVGFVDVDINTTCPSGTAACSTTPGPAALLVSTVGYDSTFAVNFFYQYRLPDQVGPVPGTAAPDGSVHGQFQPAPQSPNATVTAQIIQPAEGDSSEQTFFVTFPAPICQDVAGPALLITPGVFDFGGANVGSASGVVAFNVVNVGKLATPINGIALGGGQAGDFVVDSNGCNAVTLVAGASCPVTVHFAPAAAGVRTATMTATSSNGASASASLVGTGVRPPGLTINPATKDFGSVPERRGSSAPAVFTVTNTGSQPQTITSVALTGSQAGQFAVDADTCGNAVVAGGATCTVKATFQPTSSGSRTAKLVVKSDANVSTTATLRGAGQSGRFGLNPNPTDFGVVPIGTTSNAIIVTVTNAGGAALTISAVRVGAANAGEFFIASDSCTGQQISPAATCAVSVSFRPIDAGDRVGSLDIDTVDGTTTGVLQGVGIFQAILKFTPPVVSAGSLATIVGQSFPANTAITLQWQEAGIHPPIQVTTDAIGGFRVSFMIIVGERLGQRHLEPAPNPGVLEEPRPVAPLLVQAPTFRPQGEAIRVGGFSPTLVSRG